ncbi:HGxxPAAW family protein [Streptomonospora litoralis]|uniref:Uncharacterized protein n=1 Tax=Streptomonospora litoralis TaxID=2498135 RepID=A0A4P6Q3T2_9ACTN|nr:HGxxPAAW family protein [Streptomonospora litoralis]QBI53941.1 hypothetical protein EKD16_10775 [Streptomonospora litoralis]
MADEHHEDHGNTVSAWFLTTSWIVVWTAAAGAIIVDENVVMWSLVALGASVVCAAIAGIMKKAGLGRRHPRPTPPTREEWEALQAGQRRAEPAAKSAGAAEEAEAVAGDAAEDSAGETASVR